MRDLNTGNTLFDAAMSGGQVNSAKRYDVRFGIEVWRNGESVFTHGYDAADRDVLVRLELGGLGDQIAWLGHAAAFAERHGCRVTCGVQAAVIPLLRDANPIFRLITADQVDFGMFYATYRVLIFYNDHQNEWQPCDYRQVGLWHIAAYILGLPLVERRLRIIIIDAGAAPITEPHVCMATRASSQNNYWNNPHG